MTSFAFHVISDIVVCGSDDSSWSLHDTKSGQLLVKVMTRSPVTSIEFHPDGLILAVGMQDGNIEIYDVRKKEPQLMFQAIKEGCAV